MLKQVPIRGVSARMSAMALGAGAFSPSRSQQEIDQLYEIFREAGGTSFDSAHCYCFWLPGGAGSAERALGACVRRHGDVGKVCVITKGGHPAVEPGYPRPGAYLAPEVLARDVAESLERLGGAAIDLFLLHRDDARVPVGEIIDALDEHIAAGRVRAIGASNWSIARIEAANRYAQDRSRCGFSISQPQFNLASPNAPVPPNDPAMRYLADDDLAWHVRTGFPVMAYAPTANGYFASLGQRAQQAYDNAVSRARLSRAVELARQLGTTPHRVALAYVMRQPFPAIPILGTGNAVHLAESLAAAEVELDAEQVRWLRHGA